MNIKELWKSIWTADTQEELEEVAPTPEPDPLKQWGRDIMGPLPKPDEELKSRENTYQVYINHETSPMLYVGDLTIKTEEFFVERGVRVIATMKEIPLPSDMVIDMDGKWLRQYNPRSFLDWNRFEVVEWGKHTHYTPYSPKEIVSGESFGVEIVGSITLDDGTIMNIEDIAFLKPVENNDA
jgi:hypothetical protein